MKIHPKYSTMFGIWTTLLLLIGSGTIALPLGIPHDMLDVIKSWCAFAGAINSAILTGGVAFSAAGVGPLAPPPTTDEAKQIQAQAVAAVVKGRP